MISLFEHETSFSAIFAEISRSKNLPYSEKPEQSLSDFSLLSFLDNQTSLRISQTILEIEHDLNFDDYFEKWKLNQIKHCLSHVFLNLLLLNLKRYLKNSKIFFKKEKSSTKSFLECQKNYFLYILQENEILEKEKQICDRVLNFLFNPNSKFPLFSCPICSLPLQFKYQFFKSLYLNNFEYSEHLNDLGHLQSFENSETESHHDFDSEKNLFSLECSQGHTTQMCPKNLIILSQRPETVFCYFCKHYFESRFPFSQTCIFCSSWLLK